MRRWWLATVLALMVGSAAQAQDIVGGSGELALGTDGFHIGFAVYFAGTQNLMFGVDFDGASGTLGLDLEARALGILLGSQDLALVGYGGGGVRLENFDRPGLTTTLGLGLYFGNGDSALSLVMIFFEVEPFDYLFGGSVRTFSKFTAGLSFLVL